MLRIKTTSTSVLASSIYPWRDKADEARVQLDKRMEDYEDTIKDHWFLEGEVISAHINGQWLEKNLRK